MVTETVSLGMLEFLILAYENPACAHNHANDTWLLSTQNDRVCGALTQT